MVQDLHPVMAKMDRGTGDLQMLPSVWLNLFCASRATATAITLLYQRT